MNPDSIIYHGIVVPRAETEDRTMSVSIAVTKEASGFAVWRHAYEGETLLAFPVASRDEAIETAVREVFRARGERPMKPAAKREKAGVSG